MNTQKLSIGSAVYGLVLLAAAAFCFWVNSLFQASWLGVAGMGIMTWAHFFNRRNYWGFKFLLAELFALAGLLGYNVLTYFGAQPVLSRNGLTINGFVFFSGLFLLNLMLLLIATKSVTRIQHELR